MKKLIILSSLFCGLMLHNIQAQELSKTEKKEWKKKMKSLTPEQYKSLLEEKEALQKQKSDLETQTVELGDKVNELETDNASLQSEVDDYKATIAAQKKAIEKASEGDSEYDGYKKPSTKGLTFRVQVGAFKQFNLKQYYDKHPNFGVETDPDGTMRYTIGIFPEYWEADKFKKYLRDMGVKGAWVVAYKDGQRVDMKDALEGIL